MSALLQIEEEGRVRWWMRWKRWWHGSDHSCKRECDGLRGGRHVKVHMARACHAGNGNSAGAQVSRHKSRSKRISQRHTGQAVHSAIVGAVRRCCCEYRIPWGPMKRKRGRRRNVENPKSLWQNLCEVRAEMSLFVVIGYDYCRHNCARPTIHSLARDRMLRAEVR